MAKPSRPLKAIPEFPSEAEERLFWETHDTSDFVDWSKARLVTLSHLKPSTETISLRLPAPLLSDLKALANKRDVPYQSLLKVFVADRVAAEWRSTMRPGARPNEVPPTSRTLRKTRPKAKRVSRAARNRTAS
jgi:predicted DNA binding CopG/RHH family protein